MTRALLLFCSGGLRPSPSRTRCPASPTENQEPSTKNQAPRFRTLNAAAPECTELTSPNAVQLAAAPVDGWYLISPLGNFPRPDPADGTQIFGLDQAAEVVRTFNSLTGRAGLYFKNMWHGLGAKASIPIFEGHADADPKRWKTLNQLGEITDLRADDQGLWGLVTWNTAGLAKRTEERGPLKPSPIFWHEAKDDQGRVYPALLESVGLVRFPNIKTAPTWTQNAAPTLARNPQAENQNENIMTPEQIMALRKALGLPESSDFSAILAGATTANAAVATLAERDSALSTANSARTDLETKLTTANGEVTTLTKERDTLKTANAGLTTEVATLRTGVLDLAGKKGAITPAEREGFATRLATANTAPDALKELQTRKAMNVQSLELNGNRIDLSTANARANALGDAVQKRMKADGIGYDDAFARCSADPQLKPLFDAMNNPQTAAA